MPAFEKQRQGEVQETEPPLWLPLSGSALAVTGMGEDATGFPKNPCVLWMWGPSPLASQVGSAEFEGVRLSDYWDGRVKEALPPWCSPRMMASAPEGKSWQKFLAIPDCLLGLPKHLAIQDGHPVYPVPPGEGVAV